MSSNKELAEKVVQYMEGIGAEDELQDLLLKNTLAAKVDWLGKEMERYDDELSTTLGRERKVAIKAAQQTDHMKAVQIFTQIRMEVEEAVNGLFKETVNGWISEVRAGNPGYYNPN